jgi:hypothetical protein
MTIRTFIPCGDIPKNYIAFWNTEEIPHAGKQLKWFDYDSPEVYRQHGGHPLYGEDDITYSINSYGYRCPEFSEDAAIRVLSVGCSHVLGCGLPLEAIFHEQLAQRLRTTLNTSVINWNLGSGGASNDYILRVCACAIPVLRPHFVFVNFTHTARRDHITVDSRWFKYLPYCVPEARELKELHASFLNLTSPIDDAVNLFRNYKAVEALAHGRYFLCSFTGSGVYEPIREHVTPRHCAGTLEQTDLARDSAHCGPQSHARLAESYWRKIVENGWLTELISGSPAAP